MSAGLPLTYAQTLKRLIDGLLDKGYHNTARVAIESVARGFGPQSAVKLRLDQFESECKRLMADGKPLTADNPVLSAVLHEVQSALERSAASLHAAAPSIVQGAVSASGQIVKTAALPGFSPDLKARWNVPDPEALHRIVDYTSRQSWMDALGAFEDNTYKQIQLSIMQDIATGKGPLTAARHLASIAETLPQYQAETLARTLQLTAYRDAAVLHGMANADILEGQVRIAVLDKRTCPACIALHGTRLPLDARINDHENGRCTSVFITNGRKLNIQSGSAWFDAQPDSTQREILGPSAFKAYKDGAVKLSDFPRPGINPVFGEMVYTASLSGILGDAAKAYYGK